MTYNETTDPTLRSFLAVAPDSDFPIQNLPYGIFKREQGESPRAGVAIGDLVLDLTLLEDEGLLAEDAITADEPIFRLTLNRFLSLGPTTWSRVRRRISSLLSARDSRLRDDANLLARALVGQREVTPLLPVHVGDYTDFYSSREHATNVGTLFRGPEQPLMPNWRHLPVAYHGRSSSIVVSGTPIVRPAGQIKAGESPPRLGPTQLLDFELEVGTIVGPANCPGQPIPIERSREHAFGMVLVNDWSARDVQAWEYVPLGPFLSKSFATTISPWVVPLEALEPFQVEAPAQEPPPLPYLRAPRHRTFDIHLEAHLKASGSMEAEVVCRTNFRHLYWTIDQQIAHHTVNGCNLRTGDLLASGTISGSTESSFGSMLELTWRGSRPLRLANGEKRAFLEDGDEVVLRGWASGDGYRIGFGDAAGQILANPL